MRYIQKGQPSECLEDFVSTQLAAGLNVDYRDFRDKEKLTEYLLGEQFYLCAYTGRQIQSSKASVEHIKPQSQCRKEKNALKLARGEDVDHLNIVATHDISEYGEKRRGNWNSPQYVSPLELDCGSHFEFELDGRITGITDRGEAMIKKLRLDHKLLDEGRKKAIEAAFNYYSAFFEGIEISDFLLDFNRELNGYLPSFSFVVVGALSQIEN